MKKGQLRIGILKYDPDHAVGKPYRPPTYSRLTGASRISIKDQAREYALWLMKNGREQCAVYRIPKSGIGTSADFRRYLFGFYHGSLKVMQVNPEDYLGKLSDRDRE